MKRMLSYLALLSSILFLTGVSTVAQHGHGGGRPPAPPSQGQGAQGVPSHGADTRPDTTHGRSDQQSQHQPKTAGELLSQNTKLSSRLQGLFPAGTDLQQASSGFKKLGLFVAAAHVSHNLGIPFDQLKATMVGPPDKSLGDAIHQLKPTANAKAEANKAKKQADKDMKETRS